MTVLVGLLDSGIGTAFGDALMAEKTFRLDQSGSAVAVNPDGGSSSHGALLAEIILEAGDGIQILSADVFSGEHATSAAVAAAGLDWLVQRGARLINMSFGLTSDRPVLAAACRNVEIGGAVLIGAAPAQGGQVYPAAYEQVIAVTGDARCAPGEFSYHPSERAEFGACVHAPGTKPGKHETSGASIAVTHATRAVAEHLSSNPKATRKDVIEHLKGLCRFHGAERRTR
jgi:hypothetical protein